MEMLNDEKFKKVFGEMALRLNVVSTRDMVLLSRAIDYADIDTYNETPKSFYEQCENDIFRIKCECFYQRKKIEFIEGSVPKMKRLMEFEHSQVFLIKRKTLPATLNQLK